MYILTNNTVIMVIGHPLQALVHHNHRNIKHKAEAFSEFLDARQFSIVKTFSFHNMYMLNNIHIVVAENLDNAHLASRNPENDSASRCKPPDPQYYYQISLFSML